MNKTVRFGLLGSGVIARFHARAIEKIPEARLVGVCGSSGERAQAFAREMGIKVYATIEEMAQSPEVDAVCICTPSGLHTRQAVLMMNHQKHIVVEKPMSLSLEEADLLIETARKTGVKVCVISQFRFSPAVVAIREAIAQGAFGKIVSGSLSMQYYRSEEYYCSADWRGTWAMDGGGALMNQGIHGIDVFRSLMGPVKSIFALTRTQTRPIEVEDCAAAVLEFANGAIGTIQASTTCYPGYPRNIAVYGDQGSVILEEDSILSWNLPIPCPLPVGARAENVASSDPKAIDVTGHTNQIQNLVNAILRDEPLLSDASTGRLPLEIILGIYESSNTGQKVELS